MADEIEIDDIPLPIRAHNTQSSLSSAGGREQVCHEFFRIGFSNSNGCEHPRFVAAPWML
jgi:hypothetical protein